VIVPTLNAEPWMPALLDALAQVRRRTRRVLFIDSGSGDGTVALARAAGHDVYSIAREEFGHGRTRNLGAQLCADSEYLVYLTQDALPVGDDWLERLLDPFADERVGLVYGRQLARAGAGFSECYAREFNYPEVPERTELGDLARRGVKAVFCSNSFAAYRSEALRAVGGFPERLPLGEDMAVALRLLQHGYVRVYQPAARAVHSHAYTVAQEFRRYFDIGTLMTMDDGLERAGAAASGEGRRFALGELRQALARRNPWLVLQVALRTLAKAGGYALGRRYRALPRGWCEHLSMHRSFWEAS
jgi:rhamnosyltransferase